MLAAVERAVTLAAGAEGGAVLAGASGAGLLPEVEELSLSTRFMLGPGLPLLETLAGDLTPGVRLASEAPPTEDCLETGAEGFLGLAAPGREGASD